MSLSHFITLSLILCAIGVYGILTRRNLIGILLSVEVILNGANIILPHLPILKLQTPPPEQSFQSLLWPFPPVKWQSPWRLLFLCIAAKSALTSIVWRNSMADFIFTHSYLILAFPFLSFIIIGLGLNRSAKGIVIKIAILLSALSMGYALLTTAVYLSTVIGQPQIYPAQTLICFDFAWLNFSENLTANMGMYLDPISMMMIVVITVIAFMVNIYSVGYMQDDPGFNRFFALLALFSFSMLGLVISSNILQMFVFWELVGVSSYALIGFWYEKPSAVAASKKAFVVTRFADAFFLIGMFERSFSIICLTSLWDLKQV